MKYFLTLIIGLFGMHLDAQTNLEVEGEAILKDVNKIATFQSSGSNSFINLETNNGLTGTSIGYFDDNVNKYLFVDTPEGSFGEFAIRADGKTGIGTISPLSKLHILNGSLLLEGGAGDTPVSGAGTRMMWIPSKRAFRAGGIGGDQWDDAKIGNSSFVGGGLDNTASELGSFVGGGQNNVSVNSYAFVAGGFTNKAEGYSSFVAGGGLNVAKGTNSLAGGIGNTAPSYSETVLGTYSTAYNATSIHGTNVNDRLFVVGNGTSNNNRSNAITVLKDSRFGINTDDPTATLEVQPISYGGSDGIKLRKGTRQWNINMVSEAVPQLGFYTGGTIRAYLRDDIDVFWLDFTSQHRSKPSEGTVMEYRDKIGMIVSSAGSIYNLDGSTKPQPSESIPLVKLTERAYDKSIYGVIGGIEDPESKEGFGNRTYNLGSFTTVIERVDEEDYRLIINSGGEGGIWVSNYNGTLKNGDLIVSSPIPGIGMKQDDDLIHSYTVAKVVMDCNFDLNSDKYDSKEVKLDGKTYKMAFLACVYKCD